MQSPWRVLLTGLLSLPSYTTLTTSPGIAPLTKGWAHPCPSLVKKKNFKGGSMRIKKKKLPYYDLTEAFFSIEALSSDFSLSEVNKNLASKLGKHLNN